MLAKHRSRARGQTSRRSRCSARCGTGRAGPDVGLGTPARKRLAVADFDVGEVEVVLPMRSVDGSLPGPFDPAAVLGDRAGVALAELRGIAPHFPDSALEACPVDASDAAGVVVVLRERLPFAAGADYRDAAGSCRVLVDEPLEEEEPAVEPVER